MFMSPKISIVLLIGSEKVPLEQEILQQDKQGNERATENYYIANVFSFLLPLLWSEHFLGSVMFASGSYTRRGRF